MSQVFHISDLKFYSSPQEQAWSATWAPAERWPSYISRERIFS